MFLCCHTYYSLKFGTISPEQLLKLARNENISCLAVTDINNTSAVLDFFRLAPKYNVKPVAGIDFRNGAQQKFIGLAKNAEGFNELNKYLSKHLLSGEEIPKRAPELENAFIIYPFDNAPEELNHTEFIGIKPSDFNHLRFSQWKNYPDKLVALYPVTFRHKIDFNAHRLLRAMDHNTLLSKLSVNEQASPDEIFISKTELLHLYKDYSKLIYNADKLLSECNIDFEFGKNKNKKYFTGSEEGDRERLDRLCNDALTYRYKNPSTEIHERLKKEIRMIHEKEFASYFLINHDIVKYAQHNNFFYVGRGSGANSIVAYLLKITDVDPIDLDLYFERFINPSRINPPDFDIDFSWRDRDEIIKYVFKTHGNDHTALLATYSTFQSSAVMRELGKVFGLPNAEIDLLPEKFKNKNLDDQFTKLIFQYSNYLHDFPNHLSIHAGGILISEKPMTYYTALNNPPKGFPLTQFSMLEAEDVGLYKFDILSQRGLGKVKDAIEIIKQNRNEDVDIRDIEKFKHDEDVRENLRTANLIGCFYVESPGMRMLLTKLKATTYLDLVAASSIIRPGVAQSGMMREYILRFHNKSTSDFVHPKMQEIMPETFGVMVYQEDVIKVAHIFAGLTLTEADMLRRGMSGKYRGRAEFKDVEDKFMSGCRRQGHSYKIATEVWRQVESFAGYAFSKGHSASYAVESYQCMYLKTYYPLEYMTAVINNDGGFYAKEFYIHEARKCGANIQAPEINKSDALTCIDEKNIYLGFNLIKEFETQSAEIILQERNANGEFLSLENFMSRVSIPVEQLRLLIRIGAFRFTGRTKKQLLWDIHSIIGNKKKTEKRNDLFQIESRHFDLPVLHHGEFDDAFDELELLDFPLSSPFNLLKESMPSDLCADDLKNHLGKIVSIIGYLVTRKYARTKHGQEMNFGTFLDKNGNWIDTTHFPDIVKRFPLTGRSCCYLITGKVVEEFDFYSIDVTELKRLDSLTRDDVIKKSELAIAASV